MLKYEWKNGWHMVRLRVLAGLGILIFIGNILVNELMPMNESMVSFGDCWLQLFLGKPEYIRTPDSEFELPVLWFLFYSYLLFLVCSYPADDLKGIGIQGILRCQNRQKWFLSKAVWCMEMVLLYFVAQFLIFMGSVQLYNLQNTGNQIFSSLRAFSATNMDMCTLYILPVLVGIVLCLLELILTLISGPVVSYIIMLTYLIVSVYVNRGWLLANHAMLLRNRVLIETGRKTMNGVAECAIVCLVIILAGITYIEKMDIISRREQG
ncbi:hypothetical protein BRYFOR_06672 [Marvinbryantia formatexigens DSM 14469]|uniref:Uncharacterized protein n=1 Tax=Marvinbryantia formatexigens DSM 14469 TaxID=478749 RepID=C6LD14_9FIRM|nr:DUF2705 family protein [Marvinbryantia formatexigens]EET61497.1 hypothetical protein BRYFOR_06672 [Marvinbryantia formatexigens DSM 14469]UWO26153.1 DUF2705 family protein [Marvinbryantia formatexigens DSM 14469]SDF92713.1 hypothetical protein SAMN05660368_01607 [Marvinbryantia formatexigens]